MIEKYKQLSTKWHGFEVNGKTYYGRFEGKKIVDLQTRENGMLKRIDIESVSDQVKQFINGIAVVNEIELF